MVLWDISGKREYDRFCFFLYFNVDVIFFCYFIDNIESLVNILEKWVLEVKFYCLNIFMILIGNKKDIRNVECL